MTCFALIRALQTFHDASALRPSRLPKPFSVSQAFTPGLASGEIRQARFSWLLASASATPSAESPINGANSQTSSRFSPGANAWEKPQSRPTAFVSRLRNLFFSAARVSGVLFRSLRSGEPFSEKALSRARKLQRLSCCPFGRRALVSARSFCRISKSTGFVRW